MLGKKVAIDLGSGVVRLFVKGEGIVYSEPALIALSRSDEPLGIGVAALEAAALPGGRAIAPVRGGVVVVPAAIDMYLGQLLSRVAGRQRIFRPDAMVSVAAAMSGDGRRIILDGLARSGTRTAYLIDVPLAAAIGAGCNIASRESSLIVDAGEGTTEVAVLALEGTVAGVTLSKGGHDMDEAIIDAVRATHGAEVAPAVADVLKRELGSAVPLHEERVFRVAATRHGTQEWINVSSNEVCAAVQPVVETIVDAVRRVLEDTPASLLASLRERTGMLTGGGSRLRGLDRHLAALTGMRFAVASDPEGATLRGCSSALDNLDLLKRNFLYVR